MFNKILLIDPKTLFGQFWERSLAAEGYEIVSKTSPAAACRKQAGLKPDLVLINGVNQSAAWVIDVENMAWSAPVITITDKIALKNHEDRVRLQAPFAFQDLLLLVQDTLYHRTLVGHRPFQLSAALIDRVEEILQTLRADLRARCVILSSSSGRLIKTAGAVEQGPAISLAALVAGGFVATARAAQLLGHGEMFDSNLQESEGYGLYAIRLRNKLILSVDFSARITIGMVRHYTAQAAVDILEMLVQDTRQQDQLEQLEIDADFRQTVNNALSDILED